MDDKILIGSEEWCELPELGVPAVKARVDSGAKTSSLHAYNIQPYEHEGVDYVKFDVHPLQKNQRTAVRCKAKLVDRRVVKSSSGESEKRHVISTPITLGEETWDIEITLTNRDNMGYRMLLGREAMSGRLIVDPEASFKMGDLSRDDAKALYKKKPVEASGMRIAVLASNPALYSNRRLMEAGVQRGHEMIFLDAKQCYMDIGTDDPSVYYRGGEKIDDIDAVIPRIRPSITFYGCAVARQFHTMGAFCLNDSVAIARSRDKLRSLQVLVNKGVAIPRTGFAQSPQDTKDLIKLVGGAPLIVKLLEGAQGRGVVLAETQKAAESVINAFKSLSANILVQAFVKEADGSDLRCFVIDGKVVGAIQRTAAEGEFRANLHMGGTASAVKITPAERRLAVKAAKVMGLEVAGVDLLRSKNGPVVIEINSSPGLEGIEDVTGKDIAGLMIECIEKKLARG